MGKIGIGMSGEGLEMWDESGVERGSFSNLLGFGRKSAGESENGREAIDTLRIDGGGR